MLGFVNGLTITLKLCVALRLGVPLSVTTTANWLVVAACVTSERDANAPLFVFNAALGTVVSRPKIRLFPSGSMAEFVMERFTPTLMVRFDTGASVGGWLVDDAII